MTLVRNSPWPIISRYPLFNNICLVLLIKIPNKYFKCSIAIVNNFLYVKFARDKKMIKNAETEKKADRKVA